MTTATPTLAVHTAPCDRLRRRFGVRRVLTGTLIALTTLVAAAAAVAAVMLQIAFLPVLSPSMSPMFEAGDLAITRMVAVSEIQVGDVVVLPRPDAPGQRYVHRIVELTRQPDGPVVRTKGDNNDTIDPYLLRITSSSVPLVVGSVPDLGRFALASQHIWPRIGLILLVGTCTLLGAKRLIYQSGPSTRECDTEDRERTDVV
ncbi:signal peptidase I [Lentzea sp. NEAU-D13]|uniref:Signal peptidase I n=1 Tax=Lentzea alba TaxID=2714351 RepID=A0A7C9RWP7_9PSEU|nr:signal peptidase I [Lentzea alba]NGY62562.1 signal peptidase I [Lentzea alba]